MTKAFVIPGGGLTASGLPQPWVTARLEKCLQLQTGSELIILLSRGTSHKPPVLDNDGFPVTEAHASATYLVSHGIALERLRLEEWSLDTIGNVYFSRLMFADPERIDELVFIQSAFAMSRLQFLTEWVYSLRPIIQSPQINFVEVPNQGMEDEVVLARSNKERDSYALLQNIRSEINTVQDFNQWLFTKNPKYAYVPQVHRPISSSALASY